MRPALRIESDRTLDRFLPPQEVTKALQLQDTVFAGLGKLKKGGLFVIETSETFVYKITGTRIVRKNDRSIIVPSDRAILTVSTCYRPGHQRIDIGRSRAPGHKGFGVAEDLREA